MAATYEDRFWTSSDGLNLHYRNYPGPEGSALCPVLCMHGLTRNARDFAGLAEALSAKRRVIVTEMRGRGMSDYAPDSDTYSPVTYVADVEKLLAEQGITRFVAVGTSMGGLMTMLMAHGAPGRMAAVVMNDIGPVVDAEGLARISGYVGQGRSYPTWVHAARGLAEAHGAATAMAGADKPASADSLKAMLARKGITGTEVNVCAPIVCATPMIAPPASVPHRLPSPPMITAWKA